MLLIHLPFFYKLTESRGITYFFTLLVHMHFLYNALKNFYTLLAAWEQIFLSLEKRKVQLSVAKVLPGY